jgi:hypothetical protein
MDADGKHKRLIESAPSVSGAVWDGSSSRISVFRNDELDFGSVKFVYDLAGHRLSYTHWSEAPSDELDFKSPDDSERYDTDTGAIIDLHTGKAFGKTKPPFITVTWIEPHELAGLRWPQTGTKLEFDEFTNEGKIRRIAWFPNDQTESANGIAAQNGAPMFISQVPQRKDVFLGYTFIGATQDFGLTSYDIFNQRQQEIEDCQPSSYSPDEHRFTARLGKETKPYRRRSNGTWRMIWWSPLMIVDIDTGQVRTIQSGLVWSTSACRTGAAARA